MGYISAITPFFCSTGLNISYPIMLMQTFLVLHELLVISVVDEGRVKQIVLVTDYIHTSTTIFNVALYFFCIKRTQPNVNLELNTSKIGSYFLLMDVPLDNSLNIQVHCRFQGVKQYPSLTCIAMSMSIEFLVDMLNFLLSISSTLVLHK